LEEAENGELQYSMTMPVFSEDINETIEILKTTSDLLRQARDQIRNSSDKEIEGGKTQHIIFSKELAEKGIGNLLDVFIRSSENPLLANVIVVDGSPLEMFEMSRDSYEDKPRTSVYVANVIRDAHTRTVTPDCRIYKFTILKYSETIDPIMSYIGYDEEKIEVKGSALFSNDKMVGSIGLIETGLLHALMGEKIRFGYFIKAQRVDEEADPDKRGTAILLRGVKRKVKANLDGTIPEFDINLNFTGTVDEIDLDYRLDEPEEKKKLEEKVAMLIQQDCMKLLGYLQEIGSDPVGFGETIRAKNNEYFKTVNWKTIYPKVKFNVDAKLNLEFQGAIN